MSHSDPLVAVVWQDPRVDQGSTYTRDEIAAATPKTFTTFGLLVRNDEQEVAVAAEVADDGSFRGVTHILKPLVRQIAPLMHWPRRTRKPKTEKVDDAHV